MTGQLELLEFWRKKVLVYSIRCELLSEALLEPGSGNGRNCGEDMCSNYPASTP